VIRCRGIPCTVTVQRLETHQNDRVQADPKHLAKICLERLHYRARVSNPRRLDHQVVHVARVGILQDRPNLQAFNVCVCVCVCVCVYVCEYCRWQPRPRPHIATGSQRTLSTRSPFFEQQMHPLVSSTTPVSFDSDAIISLSTLTAAKSLTARTCGKAGVAYEESGAESAHIRQLPSRSAGEVRPSSSTESRRSGWTYGGLHG
jgi:hypothetical protein